jgi:hypothetical protein
MQQSSTEDLGRVKTPVRISEQLHVMKLSADSARYHLGVLIFLHFANLRVFTQPGSFATDARQAHAAAMTASH